MLIQNQWNKKMFDLGVWIVVVCTAWALSSGRSKHIENVMKKFFEEAYYSVTCRLIVLRKS